MPAEAVVVTPRPSTSLIIDSFWAGSTVPVMTFLRKFFVILVVVVFLLWHAPSLSDRVQLARTGRFKAFRSKVQGLDTEQQIVGVYFVHALGGVLMDRFIHLLGKSVPEYRQSVLYLIAWIAGGLFLVSGVLAILLRREYAAMFRAESALMAGIGLAMFGLSFLPGNQSEMGTGVTILALAFTVCAFAARQAKVSTAAD